MKLIKIYLVLILLVGCGRQTLDFRNAETLPRVENSVDVPLLQLVGEFEIEFNETVWMDIRLKTQLKDYANGGILDANVVGVCWQIPGTSHRLIEIKRESFYEMSYSARQQLMFHELGHCVLNKPHSDPNSALNIKNYIPISIRNDDGCKSSIMDAYAFEQWEIDDCYKPQINYYLDELAK